MANSSTVAGYAEFIRQVGVLQKHIKDDGALYAAALDSSGVAPEVLLQAIDDRMQLVANHKSGSLAFVAKDEETKRSASQARVQEIGSTVGQLRQEIAERNQQIASLTAEQENVSKQLSEISSHSENDRKVIAAAADQVLDELRSQRQKIQSSVKG